MKRTVYVGLARVDGFISNCFAKVLLKFIGELPELRMTYHDD